MNKLSPVTMYWMGWVLLTLFVCAFGWSVGPLIIARGIELAATKYIVK